MEKTSIRKANDKDVEGIVSIHKQAFSDFFLTSLGDRFLRLYYASFIASGGGAVFCAVSKGVIVGFSACSYVSKGFNSSLIRKEPFKFGIEALRLLFCKPSAIVRLAKNMKKKSQDASIEDDGSYAELYSIAVSPSSQGCGIGKLLLEVTEWDVKGHNNRVSLTTDYYNNDNTLAFYRALGYKGYYEFITYPHRRMWRLIKKLD